MISLYPKSKLRKILRQRGIEKKKDIYYDHHVMMKFLDKKGKIFGKLHLVDAVIILIILASIAVGISLFFKKEQWVLVQIRGMAGEWWWGNWAPPYWLVNAINVGESEFDIRGRKTAEILEIKRYETGGFGKDYVIKAKLRITQDKKTGRLKYRGKDLQIGSPIILQPAKKLIAGNVIWIEGVKDEKEMKEFELTLKLYSKYPWEAEAIEVGSKMTEGSTRVIAEVLDKKVELAEMTVVTDRGDVLARRDPLKRDVTLRMKILATKHDNQWFFGQDQLVKVGRTLFISLPNYQIDNELIIEILSRVSHFSDNHLGGVFN